MLSYSQTEKLSRARKKYLSTTYKPFFSALCKIFCGQRRGGNKKPKMFENVVYGWSLICILPGSKCRAHLCRRRWRRRGREMKSWGCEKLLWRAEKGGKKLASKAEIVYSANSNLCRRLKWPWSLVVGPIFLRDLLRFFPLWLRSACPPRPSEQHKSRKPPNPSRTICLAMAVASVRPKGGKKTD